MEHGTGSIIERTPFLEAQARLDARCDYRTGGSLMHSIYANLRELGKLSVEDWRAYQVTYQEEQRRLAAAR